MADFTFAHRQEGFDEHIDWSIRGYRNLLDDVINLSRYFVEADTNVVDIGCSTGKLLKTMKMLGPIVSSFFNQSGTVSKKSAIYCTFWTFAEQFVP